MLTPILAALAISLVVFLGLGLAQVKADEPIKTTVCELVKEPERFSGKMVSLNNRVLIGVEEFELSTSGCDGRKLDGVWLEHGKGPKRQPGAWCCGDMLPRDRLALVQSEQFHKFHSYLTAQREETGCYEGQCNAYEVTATLTGRFDSVKTELCPDGKSHCCKGGFGHLGGFCARIVIQSVSYVVAKAVDPSVYEKK